MKNAKSIFPWVVTVGSLAIAWHFHSSSTRAGLELASLHQEIQDLSERVESSGVKRDQLQNDEVSRLRKDNADLLRLRNDVRQLRDEKEQLTNQLQAVEAKLQTAQLHAQVMGSNSLRLPTIEEERIMLERERARMLEKLQSRARNAEPK